MLVLKLQCSLLIFFNFRQLMEHISYYDYMAFGNCIINIVILVVMVKRIQFGSKKKENGNRKKQCLSIAPANYSNNNYLKRNKVAHERDPMENNISF